MEIRSEIIEAIDQDTAALSFTDYSKQFIDEGIGALADTYLVTLGVAEDRAVELRPTVVELIVDYFEGDENPGEQSLQTIQELVDDPDVILSFLGTIGQGLATDLEPGDNNVQFNVDTGEIEE